jgi:hypothetical protein
MSKNTTEEKPSKISKELKEAWIKALRSGEYKQGKRWLKKDDKFCCLGVLCDVIDGTKWSKSGSELFEGECYGNAGYSYLPWFENIHLTEKLQDELTTQNDKLDKNFHEIADYIETNLTSSS